MERPPRECRTTPAVGSPSGISFSVLVYLVGSLVELRKPKLLFLIVNCIYQKAQSGSSFQKTMKSKQKLRFICSVNLLSHATCYSHLNLFCPRMN